MKSVVKILGTALMAASLAACGGGGGNGGAGGSVSQSKTATDTSTDLYNTNLTQFAPATLGAIKRWPVESSLIPVKTGGNAYAIAALDAIEATLGKTIFDRTSIANTPDAAITTGMVVSIGTATVPPGTTITPGQACGEVTGGTTATNGTMSGKMIVNLGGPAPCAAINTDLAIHEFGHALGLASHFSGFGLDMELGSHYWDVLKSLYSNPVGSAAPNLTVYTGVVQGQASSGTSHAYVANSTTTVSFNGMLAGQTAKMLISGNPTKYYEFTFAASGNGVTSPMSNLTGTYTSNSDGTVTVSFPGESVTMTLASNTVMGIKVNLVDSIGNTTYTNLTMNLGTADPITPLTANLVASKSVKVWKTSTTGLQYTFAASGNSVTVTPFTQVGSTTTYGTPVAGTFVINSNGTVTVDAGSVANGSGTMTANSYDNGINMYLGFFSTPDAPALLISAGYAF